MAYQVNSKTFKNNNDNKKKKNQWIPLVIIVALALLTVLINYFMMDVVNSVYNTNEQPTTIEQTVE